MFSLIPVFVEWAEKDATSPLHQPVVQGNFIIYLISFLFGHFFCLYVQHEAFDTNFFQRRAEYKGKQKEKIYKEFITIP